MKLNNYKGERRALVESVEKFLKISNHSKEMIDERFPELLNLGISIEKAIAYSLCKANISADGKYMKINIGRFRRCIVGRNGVVVTFLGIPHSREVKKNSNILHRWRLAQFGDIVEFFEIAYLKQKGINKPKSIKSNVLISYK